MRPASSSPAGYAAAPAPGGGVAITGRLGSGAAVFGAGEPNETTLETEGIRASFAARYGADGSLAWATSVTAPGSYNAGNAIAVRPDGMFVVTGQFQGSATFGAGEANETTLEALGTDDIFLAAIAP